MKALEAIQNATAEDLEEISKRIADLEKELAALHSLHRTIDIRINGRSRKTPKPAAEATGGDAVSSVTAGASGDNVRIRCARYIVSAGPSTASALASYCAVDGRGFWNYLQHPWFSKNGDKYSLTEAGRTAVKNSPK